MSHFKLDILKYIKSSAQASMASGQYVIMEQNAGMKSLLISKGCHPSRLFVESSNHFYLKITIRACYQQSQIYPQIYPK